MGHVLYAAGHMTMLLLLLLLLPPLLLLPLLQQPRTDASAI
jgi:hypothetical protein